MKIDPRLISIIKDICDTNDFGIYRKYSGRAMYDRECFGFSTDNNSGELRFAIDLITEVEYDSELFDEAMELLDTMSRNARSDSLGRGIIHYYPSIQWNDDADDELNDDEE